MSISQEPTINSASLERVVTEPLVVLGLVAEYRATQDMLTRTEALSRRNRGMSMVSCGRGGVELPVATVQDWIDSGRLTINPEPEGILAQKISISPAKFLADNGLSHPENSTEIVLRPVKKEPKRLPRIPRLLGGPGKSGTAT